MSHKSTITNYLNSKREKPNELINKLKTNVDTQQLDTTNISL
jgi:hypothetical protein